MQCCSSARTRSARPLTISQPSWRGQLLPRSCQVMPRQILASEWRRADALAGRVVDRVGNGRRCRRAGGFAETTPFRAAGRREDGLDMRMLVDAEQVIGVEIGVNETAVFQLEPARPGM